MKKVDYFDFYDKNSKISRTFNNEKKSLDFIVDTENIEIVKRNKVKIRTRTKEENIRIAEIKATKKELYLLVNSNLRGRNLRSDTENDYRRLELINSKNILKVI